MGKEKGTGGTKRRDKRGKIRGTVRLVSAGLAAAAVAKELRLPRGERTWHGELGKIPYDFRTPTPLRMKRSLWSPDDPRIFVPRAFGVGWSVNFAAVKQRVRELAQSH